MESSSSLLLLLLSSGQQRFYKGVTYKRKNKQQQAVIIVIAALITTLLVCTTPANGIGIAMASPQHDDGGLGNNVSSYPYFEFNVPRNVTTAVGQTAFLHCRVEQLGDKAVSWIRKRDLHILTAGILTYTSDQRFQVIRPDKSENWTLQIKFPQQRDAGVYECQVNTEPKMSLAFRLNVVESKARILGPRDLYVKTGSAVTLTCVISQGPHDLGTVFWYRGSEMIENTVVHPNDYKVTRVRIETDWTDALTSRLRISRAQISDSGNYSCVPTIAEAASVNVHVINGEHPAAMQHGNTNTAVSSTNNNWLTLYTIIIVNTIIIITYSSLLSRKHYLR
ncbi:zwei Ig domain protein zig-8-like isoform X2 [Chrysoperla carnea]|uniref:zwei Ig domain protein zig-8-like isoform X2 n=1 Tax=Chrysoperla carnea TaxID=189513 RepID=UPI001D090F8A|nr:zwei Ig domain protein zig-8-like isoform X2 [Chrysoperla carnea]